MASSHSRARIGKSADNKVVINIANLNERLRRHEYGERRKATGELGEGVYTSDEIRRATGLSRTSTADMIRRCVHAGIMRAGKSKIIMRIDGRPQSVPAYEVVPEHRVAGDG